MLPLWLGGLALVLLLSGPRWPAPCPAAALSIRLAQFTLLWVLLTGAPWKALVIGALAIVAATLTSLRLWPATGRRLRWTRLPALAGYFLDRSLRGGLDVARRACSPTLPVAPAFISYQTTLACEADRVLFIWMLGMMPGTAGIELTEATRITVHVIDAGVYRDDDLRALERRLAAVVADPAP